MPTATDVRDGRYTAPRPIGEQLEQVIAGFDTTLKTFNARLGEVIKTQRDGNAHLAVMERLLADQMTVGSGGGGAGAGVAGPVQRGVVRPSNVGHYGGANQQQYADVIAYASRSRRARPGERPYSDAVEYYNIDANSGEPYGSQTRTGVRQGVADWLVGRQKDLANQYELHRGEGIPTLGPNRGAVVGPTGGYFMDEQGRYRDFMGQYASAEDAVGVVMGAQERTSLGNRLARSAVRARMGQAWAQSGSVGRAVAAGLPQGALKVAGGAAAGMYAVNKGMEFLQGQAAQNRSLQEAYGGDLGDQWDDRWAQWSNRNITGRFSMLGADNYDKLFSGAMGLGLRGDERERFINTGAGIMGQGVNAQQTMQLMSMSVESGIGLGGLAKAIRDVGNAAKEAGINASRARDVFIKNYEASSEIMFGTQNAPALATMLTKGQLSMGRQYQDVSMAPALQSTNLQAARAAQVGMNLGAFQYALTQSPEGSIIGAEGFIVERAQAIPNPSGGPRLQELVDQYLALHPEYDSEYNTDDLGLWIMQHGYPDWMCQSILQEYGNMSVSLAQAPGVLGNFFTPFSPGRIAAKTAAQTREDLAPRAFTRGDIDAANKKVSGGQNPNAAFLGLPSGATQDIVGLQGSYLAGLLGNPSEEEYAKIMGGGGGALAGVTRYPAAEELLRRAESLGLSKDTKVRVMTTGEDGKLVGKIVSLAEAFLDFPDQIGTTATYVSGIDNEVLGKTGSEITGAPKGEPGVYPASSKKILPAGVGQTDAEFRAEQAKKEKEEGSSGGTVKLDLSDAAKQVLIPLMENRYTNASYPIPSTP